ncbi:MAG: PRC and DUF2382 domain-containing protein, partial [Actinomycetota bacterium]|nr:PRC and DUF2382 domain-containing protein [Actinomycetota bacterium]
MHETIALEDLRSARGQPVYASDGAKIGKVEEIFLDEETGRPEWIGVGTGFLGSKRAVVPVAGMSRAEDGFRVPYTEDQVNETPDIDSDEISQETEARLYSIYGIEYSERRSGTGLPEDELAGGAVASETPRGFVGERDVVRSEEELEVGKRDVEAGRARLRKWVETEPVAMDVELQRETARVTREPIDEPVSGTEIGEEEVDVPLRAEQPVIEKQTVAKERVGLEKDVETKTETVSEELRKERVDV